MALKLARQVFHSKFAWFLAIGGVLGAMARADGPVFSVTTNSETHTVTVNLESLNGAAIGYWTEAYSSPEVRSVIFGSANGHSICYAPTALCTYDLGTIISNAQVCASNAAVLGFGPVQLGAGNKYGNFYANHNTAPLDVTNKLVFAYSESAFFGTDASRGLAAIAHCIASSGAEGSAMFGRSGSYPGYTILRLDDPSSEALNYLCVRGANTIEIDGGVLKARSTATGNFIRQYDANTPNLVVSKNGFTFDAAEGADVALGFAPTLAYPPEEHLESLGDPAYPQKDDGSFEADSAASWGAERKDERAESSGAGVKANGAGGSDTWIYDKSTTRYGSKFYVLRAGWALTNKVANAVEVDQAGDWYVNFAWATRANYNNNNCAVTVTVTKVGEAEGVSKVLPAQGFHGFIDANVGPFALTAGEYLLKFQVSFPEGTQPSPSYAAISFDNIYMRRGSKVVTRTPVVKTGAGKLTVRDFVGSECVVQAAGGTLALERAALTDVTLSVADGATLDLTQVAEFSGSTASVANGGTLRVGGDFGPNLVANPSFEEDGDDNLNLHYSCPAKWSWRCVTPNQQNDNGSGYGGYQGNGGALTPTGPFTPAGTMTAALREGIAYYQTVTVPKEGDYHFSCLYARRVDTSGYVTRSMYVHVRLDNQALTGTGLVPGDAAFQRFDTTCHLTAGTHRLEIEVAGDEETTMRPLGFVDDVRLQLDDPNSKSFDGGTLVFAPGATAVFANDRPMVIDDVRVNGKRINGGRGKLAQAGVNVSGDGVVHFGQSAGTCIILR